MNRFEELLFLHIDVACPLVPIRLPRFSAWKTSVHTETALSYERPQIMALFHVKHQR